MKSRPNLKQACDGPPQQNLSLCRLCDAAQDLQKCALSGAVGPMIPTTSPFLTSKLAFLKLPAKHVGCLARKVAGLAGDDVVQRMVVPAPFASSVAEQIALRQILNGDEVIRHGCAIQVQIRSARLFSSGRPILPKAALHRFVVSGFEDASEGHVVANCSRCAIRLQIWARLPAVGGSVGNRRYDQQLHEPSTS
jgi:hypothetical protein